MSKRKITGIGEFAQRLTALIGTDSKSAFARKTGLSTGAIENYLNGQRPGADILVRIGQGTGCNLAWLLYGDGEPFPPVDVREPAGQRQIDQLVESTTQTLLHAIDALVVAMPLMHAGTLPDEAGLREAATRLLAALEERGRRVRGP